MEIKIGKTVFRLEYSFLFLLSFALLYGYENTAELLLFSAFHETGHLIALLLFHVRPYLIELSFYGIGLRYENYLSKFSEFIVIICGPAVNLVLFLFLKDEINLLLFMINVIPVFPLDGGRIVRLLLPKASAPLSVISLIILLSLSLYLYIEYGIFTLLLIIVYLLIFNFKEMHFG